MGENGTEENFSHNFFVSQKKIYLKEGKKDFPGCVSENGREKNGFVEIFFRFEEFFLLKFNLNGGAL